MLILMRIEWIGMPKGLWSREGVPSLFCVSRYHGCHASLQLRELYMEFLEGTTGFIGKDPCKGEVVFPFVA